MFNKPYDFSGWATRHNMKCTDGKTIRPDAFKHCDGAKVPLIWNHQHGLAQSVLGHGYLENRPEGVYVYGLFNNTPAGRDAKEMVKHGDVGSLSIFANKVKQIGGDVVHGAIREVSLVLAGANPGAMIDFVFEHAEGSEELNEAYIWWTDKDIELAHAEDGEGADKEDAPSKEKTIGEVIQSMTEEQQAALYAVVGSLVKDEDDESEKDDKEDKEEMKHNVFEGKDQDGKVTQGILSHSDISAIFDSAHRNGSLRDAVRDADIELTHGITDIEMLFPDAKNMTNTPQFISREMDWVQVVMNGVHKTPFSRVKSMFADITEDEARAKGYIKGDQKVEEVFTLLRRETTPQTVYKLQKLDRDDVIDITDFDVVSWIKAEMRVMLNEELARAILIGDGRSTASREKIKEDNIRPIWKDVDMFTIKADIGVDDDADEDAVARATIRTAVKARVGYKGSGNPTLFTTEGALTDMLLLEDSIGHRLYESTETLARSMRVANIVTVEPMVGQTRTVGADTFELIGIIVNLKDYNVGADKGGAVSMFEDFDINFNKQEYLIETRCSGAMTKPFSAIALERKVS